MLRVRFLHLTVFSIAAFLPGIVVDSEGFVTASLTRGDRAIDEKGWFCVPEEIDGNSGGTEEDTIEDQAFRCSAKNHPIPGGTTAATPPPATAADSLHGRLLCASQCAYLSAAELRTGSPYFRGAGFLAGTSVRRIGPRSGLDACLVGRTVDGIVVAFRGTSGAAPLEWLQNARIDLQPVPRNLAPEAPPGARIHAGFSGILRGRFGRGIRKAILDLLVESGGGDGESESVTASGTKIYVTGHSKGGSLATLFALMMHHDKDLGSPELVCTFGAARVGNSAFGSYYDGLVDQVTYENDLDIIPFLPPGQKIMDDIEKSTDDPEAMMEMLDDILEPATGRNRRPGRKREPWYYHPIGKRTYIDPSGNLLHPVPRNLDTRRIKDLEGKTFRDLRRAHCSSCSIEEEEEEGNDEANDGRGSSVSSSTCSGGYFAALAPEICERASVSAASSAA